LLVVAHFTFSFRILFCFADQNTNAIMSSTKEAAQKKKACVKLWKECHAGTLVTRKALVRLRKADADVEFRVEGETCLWVACARGHLRTVNVLLAAAANKEAGDDFGATCLYVAAQEGRVAVVEVLLGAGARVDAASNGGATPLFIAAQFGHDAVVKVLLTAGADADASANDGATPLIQAAYNGHASCVRLLLAHGCNVDAVNAKGNTALMCAADQKHVECVRLLMRKGGADANIASTQSGIAGQTPLEHAIATGADAATLRELRRVCRVCGKSQGQIEGNILKCSKCLAAYYCSATCQLVDWPKHKAACKAPAAGAKDAASEKERK
jgi:ankyrin repeat protein